MVVKAGAERDVAIAMSCSDLDSLGRYFNSVVSDCGRVVPFTTINVVARVALMTTLNAYALCCGHVSESQEIFYSVCGYVTGRTNWTEFVEEGEEIQRKLGLSDAFSVEALQFFRDNAPFLMKYLEALAGDVGTGEEHLAGAVEETIEDSGRDSAAQGGSGG